MYRPFVLAAVVAREITRIIHYLETVITVFQIED